MRWRAGGRVDGSFSCDLRKAVVAVSILLLAVTPASAQEAPPDIAWIHEERAALLSKDALSGVTTSLTQQGVSLEIVEVEALPAEPEPQLTEVLAHAGGALGVFWLVRASTTLDLFVAVPGRGRFLVRRLVLGEGPYALAQTLSVILRTAADGLRRGEDVGVEAPPPPAVPPPTLSASEASPPSSSPAATPPASVSLVYAANAYGEDALSHQGSLAFELGVLEHVALEAGLGAATPLSGGAAGARVQVDSLRARLGVLVTQAFGDLALGVGTWGNVAWLRTRSQLPAGFRPAGSEGAVTPSVISLLVLRYALGAQLLAQVRLGAELELEPRRWVVEDGARRIAVLTPWLVRPTVELAVGLRL